MSGPDPTRFPPSARFKQWKREQEAAMLIAREARDKWHAKWAAHAAAQGWCLFECAGCNFQLQKLDCPDEWVDSSGVAPPEWDNDAIAWGIVYHGTDPMHEATREFLKQHAPTEWALIEEACNGSSDTKGALHPGTGAADGG